MPSTHYISSMVYHNTFVSVKCCEWEQNDDFFKNASLKKCESMAGGQLEADGNC